MGEGGGEKSTKVHRALSLSVCATQRSLFLRVEALKVNQNYYVPWTYAAKAQLESPGKIQPEEEEQTTNSANRGGRSS